VDVFRQIISHVIASGDLQPILDAGARREWFGDPDALAAWDFIAEYNSRYGRVPSARVFASEYPNYELETDLEPLDYVLDEARERRRAFILDSAIYQAARQLQHADSERAMMTLSAALAEVQLEVPSMSVVDITRTGASRMARYRELWESDGGRRGIPSGFVPFDDRYGGWRPGNFVVFGGRAKSGKSTMLLLSAIAAWQSGKKIMFVSFEMSEEEQAERLDAIEAMVSHTALREGSLPPAKLRQVERAVRAMEVYPSFWLLTDPDTATTPSGILAQVDIYQPDIVFVDGLYMMSDDRGEDPGSDKALRHICEAFKFGAMKRKLPIVSTTQMLQSKMRGEEVELYSFGYSSGMAQWADVLIGVQVTDDPIILKIRFLALRNGTPFDIWFYRDWSQGKFYASEYDPFGENDAA
jgi:Replicative DNA helicase